MARRLMPDVVVVIPGILGSVLQQRGREVWGLSAAAGMRALGSLGASINGLALSGDDADPDVLVDDVEATRVLPDLHLIPYLWKIDGYTRLAAALDEGFRLERNRNYFEFPYDWRRDNRAAARRLRAQSERWLHDWRRSSGNASARLVIVAHSMGGIIARYFLEVLEGWRDTRALITFGTPYRGSVNALKTLVEGIRKGPLGIVDLTRMVRSLTSVFQLLPTYPCVVGADGKLNYVADAVDVPFLPRERLKEAAAFHAEIREAVDAHERDEAYRNARYRIMPVVGTEQETLQSATIAADGTLQFLHQHGGLDLAGDGTVPRISATPVEMSNLGIETYAATCHASLQNAETALHHVCEAITALYLDLSAPIYRIAAPAIVVSLDLEDAYWHDERVRVRIRTNPAPSPALRASIQDAQTSVELGHVNLPAGREGWISAELPPLAPGAYRLAVEAAGGARLAADVFAVYQRGS